MSEEINRVISWIEKADHDLGTAKITLLHIPEYLDTVTFHCQQAVEKYLKSYLIFLGMDFRFTHDLLYLVDLINQKDCDFEEYYDSLIELQGYAVEVRYPNEVIEISLEVAKKSIVLSKNIRDLVLQKNGLKIECNPIIEM